MPTLLRTPADSDWDEARLAWNLAIDQRPEAVAFPTSAEEVADVVRDARERGLRVAAQATGHGAGAMGSLGGTVLLKTERMRAAKVDPASGIARVEAGAQWQDVVPLAAEHGLAALAGSAADVGVVGYTLGGGIGFLARRYGLASNSVTAAELVTADGQQVRVDAGRERDLFWAVRGGGGGFGVVTALEFQLHPVASLYGGVLFWSWERAGDVLRAWRDWTATVPDEVTSIGRLLQVPDLPMVPEPLRGRQFVVVEVAFLGSEEEGAELMAPLRALGPEMDTFRMMPPTEIATLHNDPPEPVPGMGDGMLLAELPDAALDAWVAATGPGSGSPFVGAEIRHLGGALGRAPAAAGALPMIEAPFAAWAVGMTPVPEAKTAVLGHLETTTAAMKPWDAGRAFANFKDRRTGPAELWGTAGARMLKQIKDQVDPDDVIRGNHPV